MKELILSSPVIILLIVAIAIVYFFVIFHYVGRNKKLSAAVELLFFGIFIITISGATGAGIGLSEKLHPRALMIITTTMPTIVGQIGFYSIILCIMISRLRYTLKDYLNVVADLLTKAPFFCSFILLASFSFFWSNALSVTLKGVLVFLETSLFAIYFGKQYSWKEIYRIWRWLNIIIVIVSIFYGFKENQGSTWHGVLGHKNQFSFIMAQTVILWVMNAVYSPKNRYLSIVFVALSFFALLKGNSGASKVLIVVLLGLWGFSGFVKRLKVQWAFLSVVLFMIVSICLTIVVTENLEFIVVDTLKKDLTLTGRTDFWPLIIDKINERPILGYGMAGFWQPWREEDNPGGDIIVASTQFQPQHSHNGFLDLALELGWLGLALYICTVLNNIAKAVVYLNRNRFPEAGLPLLLITYTVMTNLTETGLIGVTSIWFWYAVTTVRLTLDTSGKTYGETKRSLEPAPFPLRN
jgi:O-antigen ligase